MQNVSVENLQQIINDQLDACHLTRGLCVSIWKTTVVFEEGNNWMSYIEPLAESRDSYQPSPEAKKMITKILGDARLKYNLL